MGNGLAGLSDGYLGIGLDAFGNYSNPVYDGTGCTPPTWERFVGGQVTVRGPGNASQGYCAINSTLVTDGGANIPLAATNSQTRTPALVPVEVAINPAAAPVAMVNNPSVMVPAGDYAVVFTDLSGVVHTLQGPLPSSLNGQIPSGLYPSGWINPSTGIPYQLTFGWVGSTGSLTDIHEVSSVQADTLNGAPVLFNITNTDSGNGTLPTGQPATWTVNTATTASSAPEADQVTVTDTFTGPVTLSGASGTGWNCLIASETVTCNYPVSSALPPGTSLPAITISGTPTGAVGSSLDSTATVSSADGLPISAVDNDTLAASLASPKLNTTVTGGSQSGANITVPRGTSIKDIATLSEGANPGGTITFDLYGPNDVNCGTSLANTVVNVTGNGSYSSTAFPVTNLGIYRWSVSYSGDPANHMANEGCGQETASVTPQLLTGRAYALAANASVLGIPLTITPTPDTGSISTTSSTVTTPSCVTLSGLISAQALCTNVTTVAANPSGSSGFAEIANAVIGLKGLPVIGLRALNASSVTTCAGSQGSVTIGYLAVGSDVLISTTTKIKPNTAITVGGISIILDAQAPVTGPDHGLTVNAVTITINELGVKADVVLASAESDIGNCP